MTEDTSDDGDQYQGEHLGINAPPRPGEARCPNCGGDPTDDSARELQLSALGYLHGDETLTCEDCAQRWTAGIPVGASWEFADDLWCDACDSGWLRVHRIEPAVGLDAHGNAEVRGIGLHLKCPNHAPFDCPECGVSDITGARAFGKDGLACPFCEAALEREDLAPFGCYNFETTSRELGEFGYALVGWPHITGETGLAQPYGYADDGRTSDPAERSEVR